jgi:hypothetical protein
VATRSSSQVIALWLALKTYFQVVFMNLGPGILAKLTTPSASALLMSVTLFSHGKALSSHAS